MQASRSVVLLQLLLASMFSSSLPVGAASANEPRKRPDAGAQTYIVTFVEAPLGGVAANADGEVLGGPARKDKLDTLAASAVAYRSLLRDRREARLAEASRIVGRDLVPGFVYDVAINGVALRLTTSEAERIRSLAGVRQVRAEPVRRLQSDRSVAWIGGKAVWSGAATGSGTRGEGVVVGTIDGGIDPAHDSFKAIGPSDGYLHVNPRPAFLGRCLANPALCNGKLIGVWDFIADASGITGNAVDDIGHGTHVASTIAGNVLNVTYADGVVSQPVQMSGVAPHAHLVAYKACAGVDCSGAAVIAAIEQAIVDQVDVLNLSLSGPASDPWAGMGAAIDDDAEALLAARNAGITVVVAAGDGGPLPGSLGSPGNAPWVLAVANASSNRGMVNRLVDFAGGGAAPGGGGLSGAGNLSGASSTGVARISSANYPYCGNGPNDQETSSPFVPSGASLPPGWTPTLFSGQIVICRRGRYARLAMAKNLQLAGAAAMVLVNGPEQGSDIVADNYALPTVHLNHADGQKLLSWLAGASAFARVEGTTSNGGAVFADILSPSSGRGPVAPVGVLKPDVSAPGINIVAASAGVSVCATQPVACYRFMTGTSVASAHVAGAAALLVALHPTWTPAQVSSALVLSAEPGVRDAYADSAAPHERGAGRVDVARAAKAGLGMVVTDAEFRAASNSSGDALNLPGLVSANCVETCSFTRTFTDLAGGGSWSVRMDSDGASVGGIAMNASFQGFPIDPAGTWTVTFNFDVRYVWGGVGQWVYTSVLLADNSGNNRPSLRLPVALYVSPGNIPEFASPPDDRDLERGNFELAMSGLLPITNGRYVTTDLFTPDTATLDLARDDNGDALDPCVPATAVACSHDLSLTIPASPPSGPVRYRVEVSTDSSTTGANVDLYLGRDADADGPDLDDVLCAATAAKADERCGLSITSTGVQQILWVRVRRPGNDPVPTAAVQVDHAVFALVPGTRGHLVATGPGHAGSGETVKVRLSYDDTSFLPGERRVGALMLQRQPGDPYADVPVLLKRSATPGFAPYAMVDYVPRVITLRPGETHDKLFLEIPAGSARAEFRTADAAGIRLEIHRSDFTAGPEIPPSPNGTPLAVSTQAGSDQVAGVHGNPTIPQGRYYMKVSNTGNAVANVTVSARLTRFGVPAVDNGSYFNPARGGHGAFLYDGGSERQLIWYTYLPDGSPTWYFAQAAVPASTTGVWVSNLYRSAWNGSANHLTAIGRVMVVPTGPRDFIFTYDIEGETGSEPLSQFVRGCAVVDSVSINANAHWYSPGHDGFGYSVHASGSYEFYADFVYDGQGIARFLLAERLAPFNKANTTLPLDQLKGFCPTCAYRAPTRTTVGSLTRQLSFSAITTIGSQATYVDGIPGTWNATYPVTKLGLTDNCYP